MHRATLKPLMKRLTLMLASGLTLLVVAGCGDDAKSPQPSPAPVAAQPEYGQTAPSTERRPTDRVGTASPQKEARSTGASSKRSRERSETGRLPENGDRAGKSRPSRDSANTRNTERLKSYLRNHFAPGDEAQKSWYQHLEGASVSGSTTTLTTDIDADRTGKTLAHEICWNVIGSITGVTDVVRVIGRPGGSTLAKCVP